MNRFLLFDGDNYYPCGGWGDFRGAYDTLDEAIKAAESCEQSFSWWHIVDMETLQIVKEGETPTKKRG